MNSNLPTISKKKTLILYIHIFIFGVVYSQNNPDKLIFNIKTDNVKWTISDYLVGMHSVYSTEPDTFYDYEDRSYEKWLKDSKISTMRYPGGSVVRTYDWEDPTGWHQDNDQEANYPQSDRWRNGYDDSQDIDAMEWTSLDEYIEVVKASDITPLLGVNITSAHALRTTVTSVEANSVARAVKMVKKLKDEGLAGAFYYLGNEGKNGGWENEARLFIKHAKAMKVEDPTIKCMFNHNDLTPDYLTAYLNYTDVNGDKAGDYIDIVETHGKWPYGGDPEMPIGTFNEWQTEFPLRDRKNGTTAQLAQGGRAWREQVEPLKKAASDAGFPDIKFANNEYGLGKGDNIEGFNRYTKNLLVIDMLQEHFLGNWYMACYWSQTKNAEEGIKEKKQNNGIANYRFNPMHFGFEMLAEAQGAAMIQMNEATNNPSVYGFTAKKNGEYLIYLINKSDNEQDIEIDFKDSDNDISHLDGTTLTLDISAETGSDEQYGTLVKTDITKIVDGKFSSTLPPLTYTLFKSKDENLDTNKTETFLKIGNDELADYGNGSFTGDNGIQWTYNQSKLDQNDAKTINGLKVKDTNGALSAILTGGIQSIGFNLAKAFSGAPDSQIEIYINNDPIGTSAAVGDATKSAPYQYVINDITGYEDEEVFTLEIKVLNKPIVIENIRWSNETTLSSPRIIDNVNESILQLQPSILEAGEHINIQLDLQSHDKETQLSIYGLNGRVVLNKVITQTTNSINLSEKISLPPGVYALKIKNGNTVRIGKFIVK